MSSSLFDAGDLQRLDRERTLIEQRDRVPSEEDRSPVEELIQDEPENDYDLMLDGLLEALERKLQ